MTSVSSRNLDAISDRSVASPELFRQQYRTVAEYRIHADKCRELANLVTTPTEKKILEEMAQSWEKLADLRKGDRESEREARCGAGDRRASQ
jgi:hypothetical protein